MKKKENIIVDEEITTKGKGKRIEDEDDNESFQYNEGNLSGELSDKFYGDPLSIKEIEKKDRRKFFAVMEKGANSFFLKEKVETNNGKFVLVNLKETDRKDYKLRFGFEDGFIGSSRKRIIGIRLEEDNKKIIPYISSREYLDIVNTMLSSLKVWKKEISISSNRVEEFKELIKKYETCILKISERLENMKSNLQEEIKNIKNDLQTIEKDVKFRAGEIKRLEKEHGSENDLKDARKNLIETTILHKELVQTIRSYEITIRNLKSVKV